MVSFIIVCSEVDEACWVCVNGCVLHGKNAAAFSSILRQEGIQCHPIFYVCKKDAF